MTRLLLPVVALEPMDRYRQPLEALGYVWRSGNPDLMKRYFREAPGAPRTHIHVRRAGSWSEQFALLFRDYLRQHPDDAAQYAELKYRLAAVHHADRSQYTDAKAPFIWEVMRRADTWGKACGWEPGPTDS